MVSGQIEGIRLPESAVRPPTQPRGQGPSRPRMPPRAGLAHLRGIGALFVVAMWLCRSILFTRGLPAGTDMLGFVARARDNSEGLSALSLWSPASFGSRRSFTLESLLGVITKLTTNPVVTVKVIAFLSVLAAGLCTYLLCWRWYRTRTAAVIAGLLYMTSQLTMAQFASGHINVLVAVAAAPALFLVWVHCVDDYQHTRAVFLSLIATLLILARVDMLLYLAPFLVMYPLIRIALHGGAKRTARNTVRTVSVALSSGLLLNAYLLVPIVGGVHAPWLSGSGLFTRGDFLARSIPGYPTLIGMAREIGYLAFTDQQTWYSHPFLPLATYWALAGLMVVLAYGSVWIHREGRTFFLLACAIIAAFLGKGFRPPLGAPYEWFTDHVPFLNNLRNPNRWLIVEGLAYSILAALTLSHFVRVTASYIRRRITKPPRRLVPIISLALVVPVMLPTAPTFIRGFMTERPTAGQMALLKAVHDDTGRFLLATVPYDQPRRFMVQGAYRGWEHDLGAESSAFTGHPGIGDGGWHQPTANFIAYTSQLLTSRDPAFEKLLATAGVKYLLKLSYPATDKRLLQAGGGLEQQRATDAMPGLVPIAANREGTLYRLSDFSPLVSFRPNMAVILGGASGLAALADMPGIHMNDWAAFTADQVLQARGLAGLLDLLRESRLIMVANESVNDIAVLAAKPVVQMAGITSDLELDRLTRTLPSDLSARTGALLDPAAPMATPDRLSETQSFRLDASAGDSEIWARVHVNPSAARLTFAMDGRRVAQITPVALGTGGFTWLRVSTGSLAAGVHRLTITAHSSNFGRAFEVDEVRLIRGADRERILGVLTRVLATNANRVVYSLDLDTSAKWDRNNLSLRPGAPVTDASTSFWRTLEPTFVSSNPSGSTEPAAISVSVDSGRRYHTVLRHDFATPQDWSDSPFIFLRFRGTGSGQSFRLVVDSAEAEGVYTLDDETAGWRTVAFATSLPDQHIGNLDWSHIRHVKLAIDGRASQVGFAVGRLLLGHVSANVALTFPVVSARVSRSAAFLPIRPNPSPSTVPPPMTVPALASGIHVEFPSSLLRTPTRLLINSPVPVQKLRAPPLHVTRVRPTTYSFSVGSTQPGGVLLLGQGYDPRWKAALGGRQFLPFPALSFLNAYLLPSGGHQGSIGFQAQSLAWVGASISGLSLVVIGSLFLVAPLRTRRLTSSVGVVFASRIRSFQSRFGAIAVLMVLLAVSIVVRWWGGWSSTESRYLWPQPLGSGATFWRPTQPQRERVTVVRGGGTEPLIQVTLTSDRPEYTVLIHSFAEPQDWSDRDRLFLFFKGQGKGLLYRLAIDFDRTRAQSATYAFLDDNPGWKVISIDLGRLHGGRATAEWNHVVSIRLGTDSKKEHTSFQVGPVRLSSRDVNA